MVICTPQEFEKSPLVLPDGSGIKTGFSMLTVKYKADDCKKTEIGDMIVLHPLPKKMGHFDIGKTKYIMASEDEIALILRQKGDNNAPKSEETRG